MSIFHLAASCLCWEEGPGDEWVDSLIPPVAVIIIVEQPRFLKIGLGERQATQRKLIDLEN